MDNNELQDIMVQLKKLQAQVQELNEHIAKLDALWLTESSRNMPDNYKAALKNSLGSAKHEAVRAKNDIINQANNLKSKANGWLKSHNFH
jgi:hypothetical protein